MRVAFSIRGLFAPGQGLQNGAVGVVGLTSLGQSPYFPKLDSSFCGDGSDIDSSRQNARVVPELLVVTDSWKRRRDRILIREDVALSPSTTILSLNSLQQDRQLRRDTGAKHGIY